MEKLNEVTALFRDGWEMEKSDLTEIIDHF